MFATMLLGGCAAQQAYRDGQSLLAENRVVEGLAKLDEAAKLDPHAVEYRMQYLTQRAAAVNDYLARADAARTEGKLSDAETLYRAALAIDGRNPMAKAGVEALAKARRHRQAVADGEALIKKNRIGEAEELVRTVLAEDPAQREAQNLQARIFEKRREDKRAPEIKLAAAFRKPISLEFRDAPLRAVFDMISKLSGINFFFDKDIRPDLKANISTKGTPVEDAFRMLLVTNQLEQKILSDNSVLIYPNTPQKLKDYQPLSVRSFFLANAEAKNVANTLKTLLKTRDLVVDEKLNLLMIRDTPEAIRLAEKLIAVQDVGEPEVMLEVEVLEVKRTRLLELGVKWPSQLTLTPQGVLTTAGATAPGLTLTDLKQLNSDRLGAALGPMTVNARKEDGDANLLANPRIRAKNREKANILIGDRVPVITTTSTSTGFVSESVSYVDVGLKLEVEPTVSLDDDVTIKVKLEVSTIVQQITSRAGTLAYQIGTRNAGTVLRLRDGETQVLAGLINDQDRSSANKVPALGEIPILGRLFASHLEDNEKTEIVLSMTPRVIRSVRRPDLLAAEFETGTESSLGGPALALTGGGTASETKPSVGSPAAGTVPTAVLRPAQVIPPQTVLAAEAPAPSSNEAAQLAAAATARSPATGAVDSGTGNQLSPAAPASASNHPTFSWTGATQVKVGDHFSAVLRLQSETPVLAIPLLIGFDPEAVQVVNVAEGDYLKQQGGQTRFSSRVDSQSGKVTVSTVRQGAGFAGGGSVATVTFKAIRGGGEAHVQLLSATPEPAGEGAAPPMPSDLLVHIGNL